MFIFVLLNSDGFYDVSGTERIAEWNFIITGNTFKNKRTINKWYFTQSRYTRTLRTIRKSVYSSGKSHSLNELFTCTCRRFPKSRWAPGKKNNR